MQNPASKSILIYTGCLLILFTSFSCKKDKKIEEIPTPLPPVEEVVTVVPVNDPGIAKTMGFFVDDWQSKTFTAPAFVDGTLPASTSNTITVDASSIITKIPQSTFGQNAVWWMGRPSAQAITDVKNLHPHIIRFPGGNSSNNYFWNAEQDVLPADVPMTYLDDKGASHPAGYNYGKTNHDWEFNLEKYYATLLQTGNQGIISVNYSYARYSTANTPLANAAHLAAEWVRFDNGRTKYWEIGNEHYGSWQVGYMIDVSQNKDGQPAIINGDLYGKHVKVFIDSMQKAATEIGKKIYIGAVAHETPSPESWQTNTTKTWNSGMMKSAADKPDFYVVHNYFTNSENVNAATILTSATTVPGAMMTFVTQELQTNGATVKPIAFDEWNMFALGSKQQVSNVSGLFAVLVQGEAIKNKYGMTARWDMINGWDGGNDHGLFSPGNEPGIDKWSPRPSFYYMYYFHKLLGDRLVPNSIVGNATLKTYSSTYTSGQANVNIVNTAETAQTVLVKFINFIPGDRFYWYILEGGTDNGEFSRKVLVNGVGTTLEAGGPTDYAGLKARSAVTTQGIKVTVPGRGAVFIVVDKK
ncbi:alpha-L-arabinofuranosidase [Pedobacter sp. JCM 36344]|uniref:alpha-L-arabinofuranosidase n=1 Tax=Pedobacter sp. JCM 36344 TaxID=3374280 RepID=UPI00397D17D6